MKKFRVVFFILLCLFVSIMQMNAQWTTVHEPAPVAAMYKYKGAFFAGQNGIYKSDTNAVTWTRKKMWLDSTLVNLPTGDIWQDGDSLYAKVLLHEYPNNPYVYLPHIIRSKDNGENWTVVKKFPRGSQLIFNTYQMTVLNSKTYLSGYYFDDTNKDSSGLLKRNCDTCAWKQVKGIKRVPYSYESLICINNKIFLRYDYTGSLYTLHNLYRLENDSLIGTLDSIYIYKNFIEKSDTLFISIQRKSRTEPISHLISANQGKTWLPMPAQYKFPDFSYDSTTSINNKGNIYCYYDYRESHFFKSKDLIKWDTVPHGFYSSNSLIYADSTKQYFSGNAGIIKFNSEGIPFSENSGFLAAYYGENLLYRDPNPYPLEKIFATGSDGSLLINGARSTNGGLTWQTISPRRDYGYGIYNPGYWGNMDILKDAFKIKNKYYYGDYLTASIFVLRDSARFEWVKFDTIKDSKLFSLIFPQVWNDTMFILRSPYGLEYSLDIGKTWQTLSQVKVFGQNYTTSNLIYHLGNYTYVEYDGKYYYSTDNIRWTQTTQLGPYSKSFTNPAFKNKELVYINRNQSYINHYQLYGRTYVIMKNKLFVVTKERSKRILGKVRYEIFQADTSSNDWVKVFEAPNYRPIGALLDRGDSLYVSIGLRENIFDTTASIYKCAIADLDKSHNRGMVYWDKNRNQVFDSADIALNNYVIQSKNDCTLTNSLGQYTFYTPTSSDTLKPIAPKKYMTSIPLYYLTTAIDTPRRFAIQAPEFQDLYISIATPSVFRPGFGTNLTLTAQNRGLKAVNATVKLVLDNKLTYVQSNPVATQVGDTLTWAIGLLTIDASKDISLQVKTSATTALGTAIAMSTSVLPIEPDSTKTDNYANLNAIVIGSYDPNDKLVEPKTLTPEEVAKGSPINYTIRFQNTGTAAATFVTIEDTLANYFDLSTFRFIASSHNCTYEYKGKGIIRFALDNINLPATIYDEAGSHGFVKFSIYPKTSLKRGDSIFNKAFIYFDYNTAIITPTAKLPIQTPTHVWQIPKITAQLKIYPNPAAERVTLEIDDTPYKEGVLSLYDVSGRLLFMKSILNKIEVIDIEFLKAGEYVCILQTKSGKVYVNKFVKVK
jgi:uncharacterized repeat protein (TIGR01451 family)